MRFSIIVPVYNAEQYLDECINSITEQTFSEFEVIFVDDGSTDASSSIIQRYAVNDRRIKFIHQKNSGPAVARKNGAKIAAGEYIVPIDSDDVVTKDFLSKLSEVIDKSHPDIVCCGIAKLNIDGSRIDTLNNSFEDGLYVKEDVENPIRKRIFDVIPSLCSKAFLREDICRMLECVDESIKYGEDSAVTIPLAYNANKVFILNENLYYYRVVENSLTHKNNRVIPWSNTLWHVRHFGQYLDITDPDTLQSMKKYLTRSITAVLYTQFGVEGYRKVVKEARQHLSRPDIKQLLNGNLNCATKAEKIAFYCIKYKIFPAFKIYALLKK